MEHLWAWFQGGVMLPRPSHPVVHPAPVVVVEVAQGQGLAPALDAAAQGQAQAGPPAAAAAEQGEDVNGNVPPPGVLMVDLLGAPGTRWGIGIRLAQVLLAATAIAFMASTHDFHAVTAFRHLIVAATIQCLWSLALGIMDVYALLVKRFFRNPILTSICSTGDWVMGAFTLAAAIGSAAITVLIDDEMRMCSDNHCSSFTAAAVMAFLSWFAIVPSCLFNLWAAVYRVQGP